ncbi:MAG TPA: hypothetical protein VFS67_18850 [Polyangiaceae bacterium]|jgi:Flp pilus assembly pilin Flp|nr:hypothetical protein [Polyangiaceae bacterium]
MKDNIELMLRDERGGGFVEYIILIGLVALVAITAFTTFGSDITQKVEQQATKVRSIGGGK